MLSLLAESWTWYAFACVILIARYASRWLHLGSFSRFQAEDYLMVVVFGFYTTLIIAMNIVAHLDTNLMLPSDIPLLTPASIKSRIRGSKYVLVVEQSMIMTIWGCKICLLLLYSKLTFGLKQQLAAKIVGAYVVINLITMEILYFGVWCRPFDQYWAVPVANEQCSAAIHHLIINAVFNITSDIMMLCIPLPLLINSQLARTKKLILCILFSLGIFVILCASLNKYYSFAHPFSPMWTFWYIREASTAIFVANMPMCWTLMRQIFNLRSFNGSSQNTFSRSKSLPLTSHHGTRATGDVELEAGTKKGDKSWWDREGSLDRIMKSESEESIVPPSQKSLPLEVWETKEVNVDRGSVRQLNVDGGQDGKMYDGSGTEFETKTTVTARASPLGPLRKKSESGSR